jgi:NHS family xanthosine MFS transporter
MVIDAFFKVSDDPGTIMFNWPGIWTAFAAYSLVVAILFAILFHHKHNPKDFASTQTH